MPCINASRCYDRTGRRRPPKVVHPTTRLPARQR